MSTEELLKTLRKEYIDTLPAKIKEIETYLAKNDIENLLIVFHKLKGSGKTYGFDQISVLGHDIEEALKAKAKDSLKSVQEAIASLQSIYSSHK